MPRNPKICGLGRVVEKALFNWLYSTANFGRSQSARVDRVPLVKRNRDSLIVESKYGVTLKSSPLVANPI